MVQWLTDLTAKPAILGSIPSPVTSEIATSNLALEDYLNGHSCQQYWAGMNTAEVEAIAMNLAENKLCHSNLLCVDFCRIST